MRELRNATVLGLARSGWRAGVDAVTELAPGSGTRHWRAGSRGRAELFLTFETYDDTRTAAVVEARHAAVAELAFALDFVVAPLPSSAGTFALGVHGGALTASPWVHGQGPFEHDLRLMVDRLHEARPPRGLPRWPGPGDPSTFVVTHGAPYGSNVLLTSVRPLLANWTDACLGPRERDDVPLRP